MITDWHAYLAYMRSVQGSTELGKRKARSPSAITMVVRTLTLCSFSSTVNSSGRQDSHTAEEMVM